MKLTSGFVGVFSLFRKRSRLVAVTSAGVVMNSLIWVGISERGLMQSFVKTFFRKSAVGVGILFLLLSSLILTIASWESANLSFVSFAFSVAFTS